MKMKLIIVLIALLNVAAGRFCDERINLLDMRKSERLFKDEYKYQTNFNQKNVDALFKNGFVSFDYLRFGEEDIKGQIDFYETDTEHVHRPTLFYSSNIVCDTDTCLLEYITLVEQQKRQTLFSRQVKFKLQWVSTDTSEETKLEECKQNLKGYFNDVNNYNANLICRIDNLVDVYPVFSIRLSESEHLKFDTKDNQRWVLNGVEVNGINISFKDDLAVLEKGEEKNNVKKIIEFKKTDPCYFMLQKIYEIDVTSMNEYHEGGYLHYFKFVGQNEEEVPNTGKLKFNLLLEIEVENKVQKFENLINLSALSLPLYEGYNYMLRFEKSRRVFNEFWVKVRSEVSFKNLTKQLERYKESCFSEGKKDIHIYSNRQVNLQVTPNDLKQIYGSFAISKYKNGGYFVREMRNNYLDPILIFNLYEMTYLDVGNGGEWILIKGIGLYGKEIINKKYLVTLTNPNKTCIDKYREIENNLKGYFLSQKVLKYYYQLKENSEEVTSTGRISYSAPNLFSFFLTNTFVRSDKEEYTPEKEQIFLKFKKVKNSLTLYGTEKETPLKLYFGCQKCLDEFVKSFQVEQSQKSEDGSQITETGRFLGNKNHRKLKKVR
jgi:hypothetical protein